MVSEQIKWLLSKNYVEQLVIFYFLCMEEYFVTKKTVFVFFSLFCTTLYKHFVYFFLQSLFLLLLTYHIHIS